VFEKEHEENKRIDSTKQKQLNLTSQIMVFSKYICMKIDENKRDYIVSKF